MLQANWVLEAYSGQNLSLSRKSRAWSTSRLEKLPACSSSCIHEHELIGVNSGRRLCHSNFGPMRDRADMRSDRHQFCVEETNA